MSITVVANNLSRNPGFLKKKCPQITVHSKLVRLITVVTQRLLAAAQPERYTPQVLRRM